MASLLSLLPQPKNQTKPAQKPVVENKPEQRNKKQVGADIPPYGKRETWQPKTLADFGDGGAFPEVHVIQYPLNMGNAAAQQSSSTQLALVLDAEGHIQYDNIIKQSQAKDKIIYSKYTDLIEKIDDAPIDKPDEEEARQIADRTRSALERIVNSKIAVAHKSNSQKVNEQVQSVDDAQFYRYTPAKAGAEGPVEAKIIQMVEAPVDPLEPARFRSKKMPKEAPSPPVPIMHSPPKKLSAEEAENWKIPPCISNWKNPKGFTIALDKRLAADGRGLQQIQISEGFAKLSEAMYVAEMTAREDIEKRAQFEKMKAIRDNEQREENLRKIAQEARLERLKRGGNANAANDSSSEDESDEEDEKAAANERNKMRQELKYEVERERRQKKDKNKKKYADEEGGAGGERDITEKVALGQVTKSSVYDAEIDSRLYNKGGSGLDTGFGEEDAYRLYDKPLLSGSSANQIYAPRKQNIEQYQTSEELEAAAADRFESEGQAKQREQRVGPVQFEREQQQGKAQEKQQKAEGKEAEADPFGFGQLISETKKKPGALDHIGKKGMMSASAGSGQNRDSASMSKRSRIDFGSSSESSAKRRK